MSGDQPNMSVHYAKKSDNQAKYMSIDQAQHMSEY